VNLDGPLCVLGACGADVAGCGGCAGICATAAPQLKTTAAATFVHDLMGIRFIVIDKK